MSDQCEHSGPHGQCHNPRVDGSVFCGRHSNETDRIRGYRLSSPELREQFEHHATVSLDSVREEILLLKAIINDRVNMAKTEAERMVAYQHVTPALLNVVKCYETLVKLERQTDVVLGKEALAGLSKKIIEILTEAFEGIENRDSIVDSVARQIASAIAGAHNQD